MKRNKLSQHNILDTMSCTRH